MEIVNYMVQIDIKAFFCFNGQQETPSVEGLFYQIEPHFI